MKIVRNNGCTETSNVVPIPDPKKLFDPLYLTAHSFIDQIPRTALSALLPALAQAAGTGPSPAKPQGPPPSSLPLSERAGP